MKVEKVNIGAVIERIHDVPSRNCIIQARDFIEKGELNSASAKMFEALGAFKFLFVRYFADFRTVDMEFSKMGANIDLPNLFADFAVKIIFGQDEEAIKLLFSIGSTLKVKDGMVESKSQYPVPQFKDKETALYFFSQVLRVITEYQDRVPLSVWREN